MFYTCLIIGVPQPATPPLLLTPHLKKATVPKRVRSKRKRNVPIPFIPPLHPKTVKPSFVYMLKCTNGQIYIGATVDLDMRLRRHNKELKNGANKTGRQVLKGESWTRVCYVSGFPTWRDALQFEKRWQFEFSPRGRKTAHAQPAPFLTHGVFALERVFKRGRSTEPSIPFADWNIPPPCIIPESSDIFKIAPELIQYATHNASTTGTYIAN